MPRQKVVYGADSLTRVLYPVAICMLIVIANVLIIKEEEGEAKIIIGLFKSYDAQESPLMAIIVFGFITVATWLGVMCYKFKLYTAIRIYLMLNTAMTFYVFAFLQIRRIFESLSIPISKITIFFVLFNFASLGMFVVHWKSSIRLNQFYLITMAALTSLFILYNLPDWTVWLVLVAMSLWDLFAVLAPCGPLQMLIKTARRRGDSKFPAILYSTMAEIEIEELEMTDRTDRSSQPLLNQSEVSDTSRNAATTSRRPTQVEEIRGTIRLGLGDFVFYSLMIANVVQTSNYLTTISCFISNLAGLAITLPIVSFAQKPLPALPFPLFFAAFFYFFSHIAITPFTQFFARNLIIF
ncbi:unnamed protein product [Caenorhabditis angaria]|uniref:Presenilin n=1 Tax=Caenorhabditis angaria TaxID=860376 RepID=A0A9P1MUS4_9PELO|nr:unnamed protein product [Caenorhabditis angaria]